VVNPLAVFRLPGFPGQFDMESHFPDCSCLGPLPVCRTRECQLTIIAKQRCPVMPLYFASFLSIVAKFVLRSPRVLVFHFFAVLCGCGCALLRLARSRCVVFSSQVNRRCVK
jgi:hypothetical protein